MACNACKIPTSSADVTHWDCIYDELLEACSRGCQRCSFVLKCIRTGAEHVSVQDITQVRVWPDNNSSCDLYFKKGWISLELFAWGGQEDNPLGIKRTKNRLPGTTSAGATFATIWSWIETCTTNHEKCCRQIGHVQRAVVSPKRLLDLHGGAVVLREDPQYQKYACLSHCWGTNASFAKTIRGTLNAFKTNIPWGCLTATFRDAITICRRLGIYFLWIDSLCIIQDSDEDWKDQAGQMADIYENAYLTLAATKSRDGSGGCFAETDTKYIAKLVPGYQHIFVRQEVPRFPSNWADFEPPAGRHGDWPLLNRAWVYQEMRLSPRVLHFCAEEAVWVCRTVQRSESGCNDADFKHNAIYELSGSHSSTPYWLLQGKPRLLWYRTVEEYSRLQLTFESDKMPALAGLAQRVGSLRPGDRYIAGMWEASLVLDMLWRAGSLSGPGRSGMVGCPSWSWARVKGQVSWDYKIDTVFASVKVRGICHVSRGWRASFAEISPGTAITIETPAMDSRPLLAEHYLENSSAGVFGIPAGTEIPVEELLILGYKIDNIPRDCHDPLDLSGYILPLGFDAKEHLKFSGIHVRRIAGSETYERVGHVEISHPSILRGEPDTQERMRQDRSEDGRKLRETIEGLPASTFVLV